MRLYSRNFILVVVAILGVFSAILISPFGVDSILTVKAPVKNPEAIVMLAGSSEERSPVAAKAYKAQADRMILTNDGVRKGWSREHQRNLYSIERTQIDLIKQGVPEEVIVKLSFIKSGTVYDALAVRNYIVENKIKSILLVTSDYHTRRSLWIFKKVFHDQPTEIGIIPAPSKASFSLISEYIKLLYYQLHFGLLTEPAGLLNEKI